MRLDISGNGAAFAGQFWKGEPVLVVVVSEYEGATKDQRWIGKGRVYSVEDGVIEVPIESGDDFNLDFAKHRYVAVVMAMPPSYPNSS